MTERLGRRGRWSESRKEREDPEKEGGEGFAAAKAAGSR